MAKHPAPPRVAPLQRVVAEPITDPAEQAALDEQRRRVRNGQPQPSEDASGATPPASASRLLELSRQLPAAERGALLARLGAELPAEQQLELLARVLARLAPEALHPLAGELATRLGHAQPEV